LTNVREETLKESVSAYLVDRIFSTKNIEVLANHEVIALDGDKFLESITLRNRKTGEEKQVKTHWLVVWIGGAPQTEWAVEAGVVREPRFLETTVGNIRIVDIYLPNGQSLPTLR
jgi:thioredoxin reductase (NADPH)